MLKDMRATLGLLTRFPVDPAPVTPDSAWAFPLAGLAVGAAAALVLWSAAALGLPPGPAAGLALAVMVIVTGALHEDGLADAADGFWGGRDRDRRLEIMRDSRVGSYGVLALALSLLLRWSALAALAASGGAVAALIAAAVLSRAAMLWPMSVLPHARADGLSRLAGRPGRRTLMLAALLALGLALAAVSVAALLLAPLLWLTAVAAARIARAKIGGQTGDVLGATQQLCEIAALLALAALAG